MPFLDFIGFSLEKVLIGAVALPGEELRLIIAFLGLVLVSYYDIFNRRTIPDKLLYAFFFLSVVTNGFFFDASLMVYAGVTVLFIGTFGYLLYRLGQWGGADVLMAVSLALLVPIHPSFAVVKPNYPFILSLFIFAFTLFGLYTLVHFGIRILGKHRKGETKYFLLLIPYAILLYLFSQIPFPAVISPTYLLILSITILASVFYLVYRKPIMNMLSERVPLKKVEEGDVVALELMDKKTVWKYKIPALLTRKEIARLRSLRIRTIWIYVHLPPFLPFLLLGFIFALLFSPLLLP